MKRFGTVVVSFRNFFTPTELNEMLPLGLGREAFFLYLILAVALIMAPTYMRVKNLADLANPTSIANFDAARVISLVNQSRIEAGLNPLVENAKLDRAAEDKVINMFANQYFAHFSPTGVTPWDFFKMEGYNFLAAGENLAIDFTSAADAQAAFMNSPTHRANILGTLYDDMGAAVQEGIFSGRTTILIAQYFGREKSAVLTEPEISAGKSPLSLAARGKTAPQSAPANVPGAEARPAKDEARPTAPNPATPAPQPAPAIPLSNIVVTPQNDIKTIAIGAFFLILLALAFFIMRGAATAYVLVRTILLLLLFGYVITFGGGDVTTSRLTANSASVVVVVSSK